MLGGFTLKNANLGREICILQSRNKCDVRQTITIMCATHVQKDF